MQYLIKGQQPLSGSVSVSGAKNAALKLIIAALMLKGKSTISNVPKIRDIDSLLEIINYLGGEARYHDDHTVTIENKLHSYRLPLEIAAKTRVSMLLLAPLLRQFKKAVLPNPGGCRLGERSVDRLIDSAREMGAEIVYKPQSGYYYCHLEKAKPATINFVKKSHTGTELAIMIASGISEGSTIIKNAAEEPEINDLIGFLNQAGAKITRQTDKIIIKSNRDLKATNFTVQPDRIEAVTYIVLSALFNGAVTVKNVPLSNIEPFLTLFEKAGFSYSYQTETKLFRVIVPPKIKPTDVTTAPHPGFLTDWQPLWTLLMTQATGESRVHETVFENRLGYVRDLRRFGAAIKFFQPKVSNPETIYQFNNFDKKLHFRQAIKIDGPSPLHNVYAKMTDIRAGACLVLAALIAKGDSVITGVEQIERGYENLPNKLKKLGAKIRVKL